MRVFRICRVCRVEDYKVLGLREYGQKKLRVVLGSMFGFLTLLAALL